MVEVFATGSDANAAPVRSVSNEIRMSSPGKVYFGAGAPGIALYEKNGADLQITMLDGQVVMVRDFFVIGPNGEYSALHDGGLDAPIEVTGLVAPEPQLPQTDTPPPPPPMTDETPMASDAPVADAAAGAAPELQSGGSADFSVMGVPSDQVFFAAAMIPAVATMVHFSKDDDDDRRAPDSGTGEPGTEDPGTGEPGTDEPGTETLGMDSALAGFLNALMGGGRDTGSAPGEDTGAGSDTGTDTGTGNGLADLLAGIFGSADAAADLGAAHMPAASVFGDDLFTSGIEG